MRNIVNINRKWAFAKGITEVPAQIPAEWEKHLGEAAVTVFHELGLSVYSRADFILTEDGTAYFLEINTLPGFTPTSLLPQEAAAAGIGVFTVDGKMVDLAFIPGAQRTLRLAKACGLYEGDLV